MCLTNVEITVKPNETVPRYSILDIVVSFFFFYSHNIFPVNQLTVR